MADRRGYTSLYQNIPVQPLAGYSDPSAFIRVREAVRGLEDQVNLIRGTIGNSVPGYVSSVGLTAPAIFSVTGSPVTDTGTIDLSLVSQTARSVFAAPTGGAGTPTFRALEALDIQSGTFGITRGGTGLSATPTNGQLLIGNGTGYTLANLTAGSGISITDGAGSITVTNTLPGFLNPMTTLGDIIYGGSAGAATRLGGEMTTTRKFLRSVGVAGAATAPSWDTVTKTDVGLGNVEDVALSTWAGSTNLTTLGAVTTGTWSATSIAPAKGGTGLTAAPAQDVIVYGGGSLSFSTLAPPSSGTNVLTWTSGIGITWTTKQVGTVTSVGLAAPTQFTVTNSPVTSSGTLTLAWVSQTANTVFAGPNTGAAAVPTFRALVAADIPNLDASKITTGVLPLLRGGTGKGLSASNGGIVWTDADSMEVLAGTPKANQVLLSGATATPAWSTATYPATTTANQLLYSSAGDTITGLATANSAVLVTNGAGVPSLATDIPTAVTIGGAYVYRAGGTDVAVADGGTGLSSYTAGDLLYASAATTIAARNVVVKGVLYGTSSGPDYTAVTDLAWDNTNKYLGIGNSGPTQPLVVNKSQNAETQIILSNANAGVATKATYLLTTGVNMGLEATGGSFTSTPNQLRLYNPGASGVILEASNASGFLAIATGGSTEKFRFTSGGKLGIGTNAPGDLLEVYLNTTGDANARAYNANSGGRAILSATNDAGTALQLYSMGSAKAVNGAFYTGGTALYTGATTGISIIAGATNAASELRFYTNGFSTSDEALRIDYNGDVIVGYNEASGSAVGGTLRAPSGGGVGNNAPGATLTIAGGNSTGTGAGGPIIFKTAPAGAVSNTTPNTLTERMRLTSAGVVVVGTGEASASTTGNTLRGPSGAGTSIPGGSLTLAGGASTGQGVGGDIIFQTSPAGAVNNAVANALTERMRIYSTGNIIMDTSTFALDAANNRIGIGITSPSYSLDINFGAVVGNVTSAITNTDTGASSDARLVLFNSTTNGGVIQRSTGHASEASDLIVYSAANDIHFYTNGSPRATIGSGGNVGVGTTSPGGRFDAYFSGTRPTFGTGAGDKFFFQSGNNNYGQIQIANATSDGETSIGFVSGATALGNTPTSTNGDTRVWAIGPGVFAIGGASFGISNKSFAAAMFQCTAVGNVIIGKGTQTLDRLDEYLYITTVNSATAPTAAPTAVTNRVPIMYNVSTNKLYVYNGGWKAVTLA